MCAVQDEDLVAGVYATCSGVGDLTKIYSDV